MSIYKEAVSYFNFLKLSQSRGRTYRDRSYEKCNDPYCTIKEPHSKHFKYDANTGAGLSQTNQTPQKQPQYYPRINPQIQKTIRNFAHRERLIDYDISRNMEQSRMTEDGFIGPITRSIIEKVKQHLNSQDVYETDYIEYGAAGDADLFKVINNEYNKSLNAPSKTEDAGNYQGPVPEQYEEPASNIRADRYNPYDQNQNAQAQKAQAQSGAANMQSSGGRQIVPVQRDSDEEYFTKLKGTPSGKNTVGPMHKQMENEILKNVQKGDESGVLAPGKTKEVAGP